jgi:DNA polymerase III subunit alpha
MAFVHLHLHTQYSLLQGAIHVDALFEKVAELKMSSIAMTDTHNLFGAIDFYLSAKKMNIKPIIGCEIFYAPFGRNAIQQPSHSPTLKFHHLVLLCKSLEGYQNLCKLVTQSYSESHSPQKGQASGPRAWVDRELLNRYGNGLIVLSGCMKGEIPYQILMGEEAQAIESLQWFKNRFGQDFFLELQDAPIPEQECK